MEKAKLKFIIENLGKIEYAEIELNKMTTIIGQNSTSKTYLSYMIYGFLHYILQINSYYMLNIEKKDREKFFGGVKQLGIQEPEILSDIEDKIIGYIESDTLIFQIDFSSFDNKISTFINDFAMFYSSIFAPHEIGFSPTNAPRLSVEVGTHASFKSLPFGGIYKKTITITKPKGSSIVDFNFSNPYSNFTKATISDVVAELVTSIIRGYLKKILPIPYIICSERSAISVFYGNIKNLANSIQWSKFDDNNRIQYVANKVLRHGNDLEDKSIQAFDGLYQQAMLDNITFFDDSLKNNKISSMFDNKQHKEIYSFIQKMGDGKYRVKKIADDENKLLYEVKNVGELEINAASSSIKSLYMLDAYIKKFAQKGDLLIIDEPELNLHPSNQRKIARLLAMLANNGIQIMFTTHSDYIMNEINNLTELSSLHEDTIVKICDKHKLNRDAVLGHEDINPYVTKKAKSTVKLEKCKKKNYRFIYEDFDKEIIDFAKLAKEIREHSNEANV